ncbi:hypothetical protein [Pseudomonas azotoformans]|uniref:hypothetical protein n=1 Tax=Pseudomonas azotoformans TaxID=47878 RepID=UPI000AAF4AC6|nr:hypothetical protein [Pseudomonas azotoformans]
MITLIKKIAIYTSFMYSAHYASVQAATLIDLGHAAGAQCTTAWVNDNSQIVGNCTPPSTTANNAPWLAANLNTPQQTLPPLASGQPCWVIGISNSGAIVGNCNDANNIPFAVTWNAASPTTSPTQLKPLPGTLLFPLLRPADVKTALSAQNKHGAVLGKSISPGSEATVVLYLSGANTPLRISDWGDNCSGADINSTSINGYPSIAMNCPGTGGTFIASVVMRGVSGYSRTTLATPPGASYCFVTSLNDQLQLVGTCIYPNSAANVSKTAFWASPTSIPNMLEVPVSTKNYGVAINSQGKILARGMGSQGISQDLFWEDPSTTFSVQPILPLSGSVSTTAVGLADNNTVALNCENASEHPTGCIWTSTGGTQALSPINGGLKSWLNGISSSGEYVFGSANNSSQNQSAVAATLP